MTKQIIFTVIALIVTIIFFELTNLDLLLQNYFYDVQLHRWVVSDDNVLLDLIFYSGIKKVYIVFALSLLISIAFFYKRPLIQHYKEGIIIVLLSLIIVPSTIGLLKANTNVPCPKHLTRYGGHYPHVTVLKSYPADFHQKKKVKCFPAGHASGGFALMALFFLFKTKRNQCIALVSALTIGWGTGGYKMLIGDHFLSHTIVTMLIAWLLILTITTIIRLVFKKIE